MKNENLKASVLAASLVILGAILAIALSVSFVSVQERKSSISSSRSNLAYQAAESGVEKVISDILKGGYATVNQIPDCNGTSNLIEVSGKYKVELKTDVGTAGTRIDCDNSTADISSIKAIKSIGTAGQDARAIEAPIGSSVSCTGGDIASNLTGHWKFDEISGTTAADSSSGANTGTLYNMESTDWVAGHDGNSLAFDGVGGASGEYVRTASNNRYDSYQSGTIVAWFKTTSTAEQDLFSYSSIATDQTVMEWAVTQNVDPQLCQSWKTPSGQWSSMCKSTNPVNIFDGSWHMAAFVADGSTAIKIYVDGQNLNTSCSAPDFWQEAVGVGTCSDFINDVETSWAQFAEIGARHRSVSNTGDYFFNGNIDEVRIYSRPLQDCEIAMLYNL